MNTFVRFFRFLGRLLDVLRKALHLIVLLVVFGLLAFALFPHVPIVPRSAALVIAPEGALVEQLSGGAWDRAVAEASGQKQAEVLLRNVVEAITKAKDDSRIKALVLNTDKLTGGGIAKMEEIAIALRDFRSSGKPVIAYGESFDQTQYYLAAQADQVYLDPHGMVFVDGFSYYRMFLKDAIDKLAINVNVFRAGKFKSYTDQFSRSDMSEQEREETSAWLNSIWGTYQKAVTQARGLEPNALSNYAEQLLPALQKTGGDMAKLALEQRLVTDLKTDEEVESQLIELTGEDKDTHSFQGVDFEDYVTAEHAEHPLQKLKRNKVGVVVAEGEIVDGERSAGTIGGDSMVALLRDARFDDDVKAVVLRIDSPGGSVFASELIRREIEALRAAGKPVIASMSSTAASGGYYIAMNADEIWANPATLTGSIGVFAVVPTFERSLDKLGVKTDGLGTTSLSGALRLDRSLTKAAQGIFQLTVDHEYQQFVAKVAEGRNKSAEEIDALAQGRVWAGSDAQERGLVDQLGSIEDAIKAAAQRAKLGEDYSTEYIEEPQSWRQLLAQEVSVRSAKLVRAIAPETSVLQQMRRVWSPLEAEVKRLSRFSDPTKVYYYCMCTLN